MNSKYLKCISLLMLIALLVPALLVGCSDDDDDDNGNGNGEPTTIYIPLVLPLSGQAASGYAAGVRAYPAMVDYINAEEPIPGVELELIDYDTEYNPSKSMTGYQWAKDQGAEFIAWTDSLTAESVMELANEDEFPIFLGSGTEAISEDQGYVFSTASEFNYQIEGFMKWLEDTWDYDGMGRSPKVGAFGWEITFGTAHAQGAEDYANAHPDKFDWVGKELVPMTTLDWTNEVNALEDCDYIIAGAFGGAAAAFINTLRAAGSDAVTVHSDANMSFWATYYEVCGPEKLDGALWVSLNGYINTDTYPLVSTVKNIIDTYASTEDREFLYANPHVLLSNYFQFYFCVEMLREAVDQVDDPGDITGELLYEIAQDLELDEEGYYPMSYSETKRVLMTKVKIYQFSEAEDDFTRLTDEWITIPSFE